MEEGQPSRTAIFAAMARADHLITDDEPKILRDDLALGFSGMQNEAELRAAVETLLTKVGQLLTPEYAKAFWQSYRGNVVVRQRYTEDELDKAVKRGVSQYVILGAGLDSSAYRRRNLENKLKIFEIDLPAMQQWKKARLEELNISLPRNLTYIPMDFDKQNLTDELCANGYQKDIPAFFSWLAVTQYLIESAVFQTLREVASMASGSEIVFDYVLPESMLSNGDRKMAAIIKTGESWASTFDPVKLAERVRETGYAEVQDFGPEEAYAVYLNERTDQLSPTVLKKLPVNTLSSARLMKARV